MKIDQALIFYLLKNKALPLQGIGTFRLEESIAEPADPGKPIVIPADAISFNYDPKVAEDKDLVKFISETTGKIPPLASADLDSYLTISRQFLNIGKPMVLPNIGTLEKTNSGDLLFKGEQHVMENTAPAKVTHDVEEVEEEPTSFGDFPQRNKTGVKGALYILILVILALTVWAIWKYGINQPEEQTVTQTAPETVNPALDTSSAQAQQLADSTGLGKTNDTTGFQIVVGMYRTRDAASKRVEDMALSGRNVVMYTTDSISYKVAEPFPGLSLSDSTKIKDSMRGYYGDRNYLIEKLNRK